MDTFTFITLGFGLLIGIAILIGVSSSGREKRGALQQILVQLKGFSSENMDDVSKRRDLLVKADTLFGKGLQTYLNNEEGVGSNLKSVKFAFGKDQYNKLWEAHKLRNRVVHESYEPDLNETKTALSTFASAIDKLI